MTTKHDITGLEDIKVLVDEFYTLVRNDELLAPIFLFRLNTYWKPHLEKMYTFWNAALFGVKGYTSNPFAKHATMPVDGEHFERWLSLFISTVDTYFEGPMAEEAKKRALIMATNFERRIDGLKGTDTVTLV
ncbi:globin [Pontibacter sp. HJ8]